MLQVLRPPVCEATALIGQFRQKENAVSYLFLFQKKIKQTKDTLTESRQLNYPVIWWWSAAENCAFKSFFEACTAKSI